MGSPNDKFSREKKVDASERKCATLADVGGKRDDAQPQMVTVPASKLEGIERQLHYLLGQVKELKRST
jgi:hypothetical protein